MILIYMSIPELVTVKLVTGLFRMYIQIILTYLPDTHIGLKYDTTQIKHLADWRKRC